MGIYRKAGSKYYWMYLEQPGGRGRRVSTMVPIDAGTRSVARLNRRLAEDIYALRMGELARDRLFAARDTIASPVAADPPPPLALSDDGWCYVYFVQRGDMLKIGRTANVQKRVEAFQTASHEPVILRAAVLCHRSLETALHRRFDGLKSNGEWFRFTGELVEYVEAVAAGRNPIEELLTLDVVRTATHSAAS